MSNKTSIPGNKYLANHRQGLHLSAKQAIHAKCADCMCNYADGRQDCQLPKCPLYPFMPYNPAKRGLTASKGNAAALTRPKAANP